MSFASDWSPTGNMQASTGISSQLLNLVTEVAIFVASELFLRSFSVTNGNTHHPVSKNLLLVIQGSVLLLFSGFLYLYQRVAYILIAISIMIFCRVLWTKREIPAFGNHKVVSKPIGTGSKTWIRNNHSNDSNYYSASTDSVQMGAVHNPEETRTSKGHNVPIKRSVLGNGRISSIISSGRPPLHNSSSFSYAPLSPRADESSMKAESNTKVDSRMETESHIKAELPSTSPPGLINHGNTCFMNSVIHCLTWTAKFSNLVHQLSEGQVQHDNESHFISCLSSVISQCRMLPDSHSVLNPVSTGQLLDSISAVPQHLVSTKTHQCQQDAAEFLQWLLNNLHHASGNTLKNNLEFKLPATLEEHKRALRQSIKSYEGEISEIGSHNITELEGPMSSLSKVAWELHLLEHSSLVHDVFMGQFLEVRQCETCHRITTTSEYFTVLPLPIVHTGGKLHLQNCIQMFSSPENLIQDNKIACACSPEGSSAKRLTLLSVIPEVIVIQLTRFTYDSFRQAAVKNNTPVHLDLCLNMYLHSMKQRFHSSSSESQYDLQAICAHSGSHVTSSGHYVSYCRVSDGQWYYYNDDIVTPVPNIEQELNTPFILQNAYLLFYSKV